tara:strand:- start:183 stop:1574 length:1392 start_codon:yes stop_codon:yes gene_type:complete
MSTTGTKVPAIIDIPADIDPKIKRVLDSLKEASEVRLGRRGDPRDRAITLRELVDSGLAVELKDNPFDPNAGTGETDFALPAFVQPDPSAPVPPTPTGLSAGAAFTTITLSWNDPQISNLAFTEVWRNGSDNLGSATRVDTVSASVWSDTVDTAQTFFYWIRHVNRNNITGTFSSSVSATTAQVNAARIENAIIDNTKLVDKTLTNAKMENETITSDILAGNSVIAGKLATDAIVANDGVIGNLAIGGAQIKDAAITTAKIEDLAVDAAKMANATITSAKIGELSADKITAETLNVGGKAISGTMGTVSFNQTTKNSSPGNETFALSQFVGGSNPLTTSAGTVMTNLVNFSVNFPVHAGGAAKNYICVCTFKPVGSFSSTSEIISTFSVSSSSAHATNPTSFRQFLSTGSLTGSQNTLTMLLSIPSNSLRFFRLHGQFRNCSTNSDGQLGFGTISIHVNGLSA